MANKEPKPTVAGCVVLSILCVLFILIPVLSLMHAWKPLLIVFLVFVAGVYLFPDPNTDADTDPDTVD